MASEYSTKIANKDGVRTVLSIIRQYLGFIAGAYRRGLPHGAYRRSNDSDVLPNVLPSSARNEEEF
jgi:hypothetical protein